jgi:hypothetical protein
MLEDLFNYFRIIAALIATDISQAQAIAGPNLVWSDNPGAYEQHLMRRYENLLFPKYRRHITQSEIDSARARDLKDYAELNKRLIKLAEDISVLPDHVDSATINRIREIIDDVIQDAMGVGGRAYDIAFKTKELRQTLISSWSKAVPGNSEAQRALVLAELYYQENAPKFEVPFIAQMVREDGPIPSNEVVPALLMEKPNIIAMVLGWVEPSKRPAAQKGALQVLKASIEEGAQIDNLEEILEALGVNAN